MKSYKTIKYFSTFKIFVCLLICLLLYGCQTNSEIVKLCDYKNFDISEEVYKVSDEDLSFATKIKLMEKEVLTIKEHNSDIVEEDDIVDITVSSGFQSSYKTRIIIGEATISEDFDNNLLGLKKNNTYSFLSGDTKYTVTINDIYVYAEELTDSIAKEYFFFDSAEDLTEYIKKDIEDHRKFEYAYEKLITGSMIMANYTEKSKFISTILENIYFEANTNKLSTEAYLKEFYDCSLSEYKKRLNDFFDEYMILKTLANKENIVITDTEFNNYLSMLSEDTETSKEEILEAYGKEYVYYLIYYEKIYTVLLSYIK